MKVKVDIETGSRDGCETCYRKTMDIVFVVDIGSDVLYICKDCLISLRNAIDPLRLLITTGIDTKDKKED